MLDPPGARKALDKLFAREKIADLPLLYETVGTRSRMSVFRRMNEMEYLTSYTHAGRFYTLKKIPSFDSLGLWFHEGAGFSRAGTMKTTVAGFIEESSAGMSPSELDNILRLRGANALYNTLGELVKTGRIHRQRKERVSLYTSAKPARAREQIERRQEKVRTAFDRAAPLPPSEITIAVLVEALQAAEVLTVPWKIAARLQAQSVAVTPEQVEQILRHYGLEVEKKRRGDPGDPLGPKRTCAHTAGSFCAAGSEHLRGGCIGKTGAEVL
jgi:hypothetical protein